MNTTVLTSGWREFEHLQRLVDTEVLNANTIDVDEALTVLLDDFAAGYVPPADVVRRRFRAICKDRLGGQRRRASVVTAGTARVAGGSRLRLVG